MSLILASSSPRRKELMQLLGIPFLVDPSNYEEDMTLALKPEALAKHLSQGKALDVAKRYKNGIIIGADTFVVYKNTIIGKPHTVQNARKTLRLLSGKAHRVITGFTIIDAHSGKKISKAVETKVTFKQLSSREINTYIKKENPLQYAGSYSIQIAGWMLIKKIEGDFHNIVGLPLFSLAQELKKFGVRVL